MTTASDTHARESVSTLAVDFAAMSDGVDDYLLSLVIDRQQDAIITDAQAVTFFALQFLDSHWTRIVFEGE